MSHLSHHGAMIAMELSRLVAEELIAKLGVCEASLLPVTIPQRP